MTTEVLGVLDSTVLVAAIDADRQTHDAARQLLGGSRELALTTQTLREFLAVATRPHGANGLGLGFPVAWDALNRVRARCGLVLCESDAWLSAYAELAELVKPEGRTVFDLGQIAFVRLAGRRTDAALITDDLRLRQRYATYIAIETLAG